MHGPRRPSLAEAAGSAPRGPGRAPWDRGRADGPGTCTLSDARSGQTDPDDENSCMFQNSPETRHTSKLFCISKPPETIVQIEANLAPWPRWGSGRMSKPDSS